VRKNNEQTTKVFTTLDAYLSGYLVLKNFIPKLIEQGEKVVFAFNSSEALYRAIAEYSNGAVVPASQMAFSVKTLKSRIHSLRRNKENELSKA
jgi:hypothetical protein